MGTYGGTAKVGPGANGGTSSAVDSSGSNFAAVVVTSYQAATAPVLTDNKNAGGYGAAVFTLVAGNIRIQLYYLQGATCGTGHTWTLSGSGSYSTAYALHGAGWATSGGPDQTNSNTSNTTTVTPGSVTPSEAGELCIMGTTGCVPASSITDSYAIIGEDPNGGSGFAGGMAYKIVTDTAAQNPTWTTGDASGETKAFIATFKTAGGGGGAKATLPLIAALMQQGSH